MIRRIVRWLAANGVADVVVNLHHLPATVTSVVGDGADLGVHVRYSWEQPVVLGSAGGPRQALEIVGAPRFLIVNGDTLTDVDLTALTAAHESAGALVTLALTSNREPSRYGGVLLDSTSRVTGFLPRGAGAERSSHFLGVQIAEARAFCELPVGSPINSIGGAYDELVARAPGALRGYTSAAAFWDVGTTADYLTACRALAGSVDPPHGRSVHIAPSARVTRSILWDDIDVGAGARLDECIVTDGVRVPAGVGYSRAILRAGADGRLIADELTSSNG